MKLKRIIAAVTTPAVALAAVLSMTIVDADTRDTANGVGTMVINDYGLVDYEDMTDEGGEITEPSDEDGDDNEGEIGEGDDGEDETGEGDDGEDESGEGDDGEDESGEGDDEGETGEGDDGEDESGEGDDGEDESGEGEDDEGEVTTPGDEETEPDDDLTDGDFTYALSEDDTVIIIGYIGSDEVIAVPDEIGGRPVTAIADDALIACTWVYIPASVAYIGENAFVYTVDEDGEASLTVFGSTASYAESYAYENGVSFFAVGGASFVDDFRDIEVIFQEVDGSDAAGLNVTDGYHSGSSAGVYFHISVLDSSGSEIQPEIPVLVRIKVPYGWKDENVSVYRVDIDGSEYKLNSYISDDCIVFITEELSEFMIAPEDATEPDDGTDPDITTVPEITTPEVTTTEEPAVTTEPVVTTTEVTTPITTTTPETTTAPATTTEPVVTTDPVTTDEPVITVPSITTTEPVITDDPTITDPVITTEPPETTDEPEITTMPADGEGTDDTDETDKTPPISFEVEIAPTINVTVPSSLSVTINPYGAPVNFNGVEYAAGISSPVYTIINRTTTSGIQVVGTASIVVPVSSYVDSDGATVLKPTIQVVDTPTEVAWAGKKSVCAYVLVASSTEQIYQETEEVANLFENGDPAFESGETLVFADASIEDNANTGTMAVLDMAESEDAFTYAQFKIVGDLTGNDVETWSEADEFIVNLVLNITPTEDIPPVDGDTSDGDTAASDDGYDAVHAEDMSGYLTPVHKEILPIDDTESE